MSSRLNRISSGPRLSWFPICPMRHSFCWRQFAGELMIETDWNSKLVFKYMTQVRSCLFRMVSIFCNTVIVHHSSNIKYDGSAAAVAVDSTSSLSRAWG